MAILKKKFNMQLRLNLISWTQERINQISASVYVLAYRLGVDVIPKVSGDVIAFSCTKKQSEQLQGITQELILQEIQYWEKYREDETTALLQSKGASTLAELDTLQ